MPSNIITIMAGKAINIGLTITLFAGSGFQSLRFKSNKNH